MTHPTTTRRDMLRLGTSAAAYAASAAIATSGVVLASEANGAIGVSLELLRLIANAKRADAASKAFDWNVYDSTSAKRATALNVAEASLVHTTADAGPSAMGGRIIWTTADPVHVSQARGAVRLARDGKAHLLGDGEYLKAARRITAASLRHKRVIARVEKAHDTSELFDRSCVLCDATADADERVAGFAPHSLADMRAKLAFMVENDMGNGIDRLSMMVADIATLSAREG